MSVATFQTAAFVTFLLASTWLYARTLRPREGFAARAALALVSIAAITCAALSLGFSLYPTLSDDMSFVAASASFGIVLALLTLFVCLLWESPLDTALFCASSAYIVQGLASGLDRILHVTGIIHMGTSSFEGIPAISPTDVLSLIGCAGLVLFLTHVLLTSRLERNSLLDVRNPAMTFAVALSIVVTNILDLAIKDIGVFEVPHRYIVVLAVSYEAICTFILVAEYEVIYGQRLRENVAAMERTVAEQSRQFELSRATISAVNRRVHDIRHHIFGILAEGGGQALDKEQLRQIAREVNVYDSAVRTGNAALDVVLTEKSLLCGNKGVTFSCIADGRAVAHLSPAELYALFGNALGYAIDAVCQATGDGRRSISLNVREQMGMAIVSIEHYVPNETQVIDRVPADGGLAYEGVRSVVERHEGTMACNVTGDVLHLDVLLPLPE